MNTETEYKSKYNMYNLQCYYNGDIWAEYFRPYTFEEWMNAGCPDGPGKDDKHCIHIVK